MARTTTTTVTMDERGRITIPKASREALGVDGKKAIIEASLKVSGDGE